MPLLDDSAGVTVAQFVQVPLERLAPELLNAMLEEFASRDGTDYGLRERTLEEKVHDLKRQLESGELKVVYDLDSEQWDLCPPERLREFGL
jgi:uncharacterized protein YheU (UPF0270 family)